MAKVTKAECDRCGEYGEGRYKWMTYDEVQWFYHLIARFQIFPVAREFHCERCQQHFRIMSVIFWVIAGSAIVVILGLTAWALAAAQGWI